MSKRSIFVSSLIVLAILSRVLPHPYNFTPITGAALFGAAYFGSRLLIFAVPFLAMFISDLIINNVIYSAYYGEFTLFTPGAIWIYGSFALIALLGVSLRKSFSLGRLAGTTLLSSVLFFLLTNFGAWLGSSLYPQNVSGLLSAYAAGLPFFGNTLLGDAFYVSLLFGVFAFAKKQIPALVATESV